MDRVIVYLSEVPADTDILQSNLNIYISMAKLCAGLIGTSTQINGLPCTENGTPDMTVLVGAGEIYQLAEVDTSAYGSLPADSTQILKQGINLEETQLSGFTAPVTVGDSVNYLVQFQLVEVDNGSQVLLYYNSANPSQSFLGPNNDNTPQYTNRADTVGMSIKAGTPAPTGTQATPSPDAGWVAGYIVTIAHGQTTITNSDISVSPSAPFLPADLSSYATQTGLQNGSYTTATDTGAANAYAITLSPVPSSYTDGMTVYMKAANANTTSSTLTVNSMAVKNIKLQDGTNPYAGAILAGGEYQLMYDGTNFQLMNPSPFLSPANIQNSTITYAVDGGSANAYTMTLSPAVGSYVAGLNIYMKASNTNTTTSTLAVNGLSTKTIKLVDGSNLYAGAILSGGEYHLFYDGTNFQLLNPTPSVAILNNVYTYAVDGGSANAYTATLVPAATSYVAGMAVSLKATNANTTTSTLNVNSLGTKTIKLQNGSNVVSGNILSGGIYRLVYDGTNFILQNPDGFATQVAIQANSYTYFVDGGSANAYTITASPAIAAYAAGQSFIVKITNSNTSSSTLNVNALGTKAIKVLTKNSGLIDPAAGVIQANMLARLTYDGTQFVLENPALIAPTVTKYTSGSGTYTVPTGALYGRVRLVGGGGGGAGSGTATGTVAGDGGDTTFGTSLLTGGKGYGAVFGLTGGAGGGAGGTASLGTAIGTAIAGAAGTGGFYLGSGSVDLNGSNGGSTPFGGAGAGGQQQVAGGNAVANSGSGGGGAGGTNGVSASVNGAGGGAGGYVEAIIPFTSSSYSYGVGAGGSGGGAGTSGTAGGNGGSGYIEIVEYYQ